jgi:pimeloyl-ACP methyl ester carboxylesterase
LTTDQLTATSRAEEATADVGRGMHLCYQAIGDPDDPPLLLIAGLGQQLNSYPDEFVDQLVERGFYAIRFDNRDVGRSGRAAIAPPKPHQLLLRRFRPEQYTLGDMAKDAAGLLDALEIERAHVVGVSMGGMIGQAVACRFPDRVISLTSIMSTTGAKRVGRPSASTWLRMAAPPAKTAERSAQRTVAMFRHIGSAGFPFDEEAVRAMALAAWERGGTDEGAGVARQLAAIMKSGDRTTECGRIAAPTLVIHGDRDRMVNPTGGKATADAIPGARLRTIPGMGHDLPRGAWWQLIEDISAHAARAAAAG